MPDYTAIALVHDDGAWQASELDLSDPGEVGGLEGLAESLRDLSDDAEGPALLLLEANDEWFAVVRVDGGSGSLEDPRVFLSDGRAAQSDEVAGMLWEAAQEDAVVEDEDEERPALAQAEPVGDRDLLADLGTPAAEIVRLAESEGVLPADAIAALCERAGMLEVLEGARPV